MQPLEQRQDAGVGPQNLLPRKPQSKAQEPSCRGQILVAPLSSHVAWSKFLYLICEMGERAPCEVLMYGGSVPYGWACFGHSCHKCRGRKELKFGTDPGRPRPAPPKTSMRARTPYPPPSSEPLAPPFWLKQGSTCGVFTHVTSEPAPSLRLRSGPSPVPAPYPLRLRSVKLMQRASVTGQSVGGSLGRRDFGTPRGFCAYRKGTGLDGQRRGQV